MDYKLAIQNCLILQEKMNKTVDPDWVTKGRSWETAMVVELAEFIDHVGYKWWKEQKSNFDQAFIEIVDVFHFFLSRQLEHIHFGTLSNKEIIENLAEMIELIEDADVYEQEDLDRIFITDSAVDLMAIISDSIKSEGSYFDQVFSGEIMAELIWLTKFCGKTADDLLKTYIAKNTLNIFRQHNGYKQDTYVKTWDGKEDNVVLWEIIQNDPAIGIDFDLLYDALATKYKEVTGA